MLDTKVKPLLDWIDLSFGWWLECTKGADDLMAANQTCVSDAEFALTPVGIGTFPLVQMPASSRARQAVDRKRIPSQRINRYLIDT